MSISIVAITLNIKNNRNYPTRINVLGSPLNLLDTTNSKTEYRWDITGITFSASCPVTLEYQAEGGASFATYTYELTNGNNNTLAEALNGLGIGYFNVYTELGQTYISTYNDNYVFNQLTVCDASTTSTTTSTTTAALTSTTTSTTTAAPTTSTTTSTTTAALTSTTTSTTTAAPTTSTTTSTTTAALTSTSTTTSTTTLLTNSGTFYYFTNTPDPIVGYNDQAGACFAGTGAPFSITVYWNGTLAINTILFEDASGTIPLNCDITKYYYLDGNWIFLDGATIFDLGLCSAITTTTTTTSTTTAAPTTTSTTTSTTTEAPTTTSTTTSTTTAAVFTFRVGNNNTTDGVIDSVTPAFYTITEGSIPVPANTLARGGHSNETNIVIGGFVTAQTGGGNISLYINSIFIECINMPFTGTSNAYTFAPVSFLSTDIIDIILNDGTCLPPTTSTTTTTTTAGSLATIAFDFFDDGSGIISARATVTSGTTIDSIGFNGSANGYQSLGCSGTQLTNSFSDVLPSGGTGTTISTEVFGSISAILSAQAAPLFFNGTTITQVSQDITVGGNIYTITGGTNCFSPLL